MIEFAKNLDLTCELPVEILTRFLEELAPHRTSVTEDSSQVANCDFNPHRLLAIEKRKQRKVCFLIRLTKRIVSGRPKIWNADKCNLVHEISLKVDCA